MKIIAEGLEGWIGGEVLDAEGEKLGKLGEVYFRKDEPVVITVRSGLAGRKHRLASLEDARVLRNALVLSAAGSAALVEGSDPPTDAELETLGAGGLTADELEGSKAREERLAEDERKRLRALELEAEATRRSEQADAAGADAERARIAADEAEKARLAAAADAEDARRAAEPR